MALALGAEQPDSQHFGAPNRYCAAESTVTPEKIPNVGFPPLALRRQMKCIKTGAIQVILEPEQDKPNNWTFGGRPDQFRIHYPNSDVFECPNCHARVAKTAGT